MASCMAEIAVSKAMRKQIESVRQLIIDVGLPTTLKAVGVESEGIKQIVARAMINLSTPSNPRQMAENDFLIVATRACG